MKHKTIMRLAFGIILFVMTMWFLSVVLFLHFFFNAVDENGGVGKSIGKFVNDINQEIK